MQIIAIFTKGLKVSGLLIVLRTYINLSENT